MYKKLSLWLWYRKYVKKPLAIHTIEGSGPPIVFLHGIASNSNVWHEVVQPLKGKHAIVLVDLLGFGASPKPETIDYTASQHAYALRYSLKKHKIRDPALLVGHSMGSIIALEYASKYPKCVLRLVLCSLPIYKRGELSDKRLRVWQTQSDNLYFRAYRLLREKKDWAYRAAGVLQRLGVRTVELHRESWYAFRMSLKNTVESQHVERNIRSISMPVDIIYGKLDVLIISKHVKALEKYANVSVHATSARHDLSVGFSSQIAKLIASVTKEV